eukprot:gb/GECG01008493.1/.p1 GENE.gb/GECG01008493.1/~~gb/GECG01008493.1/.p1  ORF type:complete len:1244 (+),score=147.53 gb/GECG01008493.1/:1-3732(+)
MASVQDMISSCDAHDAFRAALCAIDIISHSLDGGIMHEGGATAQHRARKALSDALVESLESGCRPIVDILVKLGSEPDFPSSNNVRPIDVAEDFGRKDWLERENRQNGIPLTATAASAVNQDDEGQGPQTRKRPKMKKYEEPEDLRKHVQKQNLAKREHQMTSGSMGGDSPLAILCHKGPPIREGWLKKLGRHFPTWHSRYFLLFPGRLEYYTKDPFVPNCNKVANAEKVRHRKPRGTIRLEKPCVVEDISEEKGCYSFRLTAPGRSLICSATSQSSLRGWIAALHEASQQITPQMNDIDNWSIADSEETGSTSPRSSRVGVDFDLSCNESSGDDDVDEIQARRPSSAKTDEFYPRKSSLKTTLHIPHKSRTNSNAGDLCGGPPSDTKQHVDTGAEATTVETQGRFSQFRNGAVGHRVCHSPSDASPLPSAAGYASGNDEPLDEDIEEAIESTQHRLSVWSIGSVELAEDMIEIGSQEDSLSFEQSVERWCNQIREFFNAQIPSNSTESAHPRVPTDMSKKEYESRCPEVKCSSTFSEPEADPSSLGTSQQQWLEALKTSIDQQQRSEEADSTAHDIVATLFSDLTARTTTFNQRTINQFLSLLADREDSSLLRNSYVCTSQLEACLLYLLSSLREPMEEAIESPIEQEQVNSLQEGHRDIEEFTIDFVSATGRELCACAYLLLACDENLMEKVKNLSRVCRQASSHDVCFDEAGCLFAVLEIYVKIRKYIITGIETFLEGQREKSDAAEGGNDAWETHPALRNVITILQRTDVGLETFGKLHDVYLDEHVRPELQTYSANIFIQVCNLLCSAWNSQSAPLISTVSYECVVALRDTCSRCNTKCRDPHISPDTVVHVVNDFGNAVGVFRLFNTKVAGVIDKAREQMEVHHETVHYLSAEEIRKEASEAEKQVLHHGLRASGLLAQKLVTAFDDDPLENGVGEGYMPTISTKRYPVGKGFSELNRRGSSAGVISVDSANSHSSYGIHDEFRGARSRKRPTAPLQKLFTAEWDAELDSESATGVIPRVCENLKRQLRCARVSLDPWFGKAQYSRCTAQLAISYLAHLFDAIKPTKMLRKAPFKCTQKRREHIEYDIDEIVSGFAPLMSQRVASAVLFPLSITLRLISRPPSTIVPVIAGPLLLCARGAPEWYAIIASVVRWRADLSKTTKKEILSTTEHLVVGYVERSQHVHLVGSDLCMYILREAVLRSDTTASLLPEGRDKRCHKRNEDAFANICDPFQGLGH